jgi:spore coat protein CotH
MKLHWFPRPAGALVAVLLLPTAGAVEGRLLVQWTATNAILRVEGDEEDDWRIETSDDLVTWIHPPAVGTLLSNPTNPLSKAIPTANDSRFFRACRTTGLFDPTVLRTMNLTFTQTNWQSLLTTARTTGSNVYCALLTLDNGATNPGVGARYRGNTSFTGFGGAAPVKKSINLETDFTFTNQDLMGFDTFNLNNAYQDETIMRESVYFNIMRQYTVCPAACLAQLQVNGSNWGVYSMVQQQDGRLMSEYFRSNDGDRWRAPNMPTGGGAAGSSALAYLGNTNPATYRNNYELKSDYHTNAWPRLINAIYVLNNTATNLLRDKVEEVLATDRWLWFLAIENVFADDDSYFNKGADYMFYYEPESGRIHPVEHDGNEAFFAGDSQLSPVQGAADSTRPVLRRLLSIPELRQRYLAHMRTVLQESFNPPAMTAVIQARSALSLSAIAADPKKGYTGMLTYSNDLRALLVFVTNRYRFLTNHAELKPVPPDILAVHAPTSAPTAVQIPYVTAEVRAHDPNGLGSVWLYHRGKPYGRFAAVLMLDDGAHQDGAPGDGLFGAATTNYPAGTKVRFYVEARATNAAKSSCFSPPRAEQETYSYRVAITTATNTPVIINEFMASNDGTRADPQGEYDDWIEFHNLTDQDVDLTGRYLSDEPNHPRKWPFPAGTIIPANGYLLVWADEDTTDAPGLHASFKLSSSDGDELYLTDTDANLNGVLDSVVFGAQQTDRSYGRTAADPHEFDFMRPTPEQPNE